MTLVSIRPDVDKVLTPSQQANLLRAAYQRSPTAQLRQRLVHLLLLEEAFSETVDILNGADRLDHFGEMALVHAHLSFGARTSNKLAHAAAERAFGNAQSDVERANALSVLAKCETRMGNSDKAFARLEQALELDPHNRDACKRIAAISLAGDQARRFLGLAQRLHDMGVDHAGLFASLSVSCAREGEILDAKRVDGFELFNCVEYLVPPLGWETVQEFNAALAAELLAHPGMRYERYGSASELSWRIENLARPDTPLVKALLGQIIARLESRVAEIGTSSHRWANAAPITAFLRNWCVITESDGYENWHVHPRGWLSGVYYVSVPEVISLGTTRDGCLTFGLPDDLAGSEGAAAFGEHLVRPQDGLLVTFPSQCYHRTYPHRTDAKRICVAFDLRPE